MKNSNDTIGNRTRDLPLTPNVSLHVSDVIPWHVGLDTHIDHGAVWFSFGGSA